MYDLNQPWQQRLYLQAIDLPEAGPADAPLVCVSFNASWLPAVLGALSALALPASWTGDEAAQQAAVAAATALLLALGDAEECTAVQFQFTSGCVLQYSVDGGSTWIDVPGWPENAPGCYTGATGATGATGPAGPAFVGQGDPPPNPQGATTAQQACNIASYLAASIVKPALQSVVDSKNATLDEIHAVSAVFGLFTGFDPLADVIIVAANVAAQYIYAQATSDYTDALGDAVFQADVQCAIYTAIAADGYVTAANVADVLTNLAAISYTHADVVTTVHDYVAALGLVGLQMMQVSGTLYVGDCAGCAAPGSWCYEYDFTASDGGWSIAGAQGVYVPTVGYQTSVDTGGQISVYIYVDFASTTIDDVVIKFTTTDAAGGALRRMYTYQVAGNVLGADIPVDTGLYATPHVQTLAVTTPNPCTEVGFTLRSATGTGQITIMAVQFKGTGTNPFGATNCTF